MWVPGLRAVARAYAPWALLTFLAVYMRSPRSEFKRYSKTDMFNGLSVFIYIYVYVLSGSDALQQGEKRPWISNKNTVRNLAMSPSEAWQPLMLDCQTPSQKTSILTRQIQFFLLKKISHISTFYVLPFPRYSNSKKELSRLFYFWAQFGAISNRNARTRITPIPSKLTTLQ